MTSKELYMLLVELYKVDTKVNKREVYDLLEGKYQIGTKQLGGMVSALSRKKLVVLDKITITIKVDTDTGE